jgi:hypothetical protein
LIGVTPDTVLEILNIQDKTDTKNSRAKICLALWEHREKEINNIKNEKVSALLSVNVKLLEARRQLQELEMSEESAQQYAVKCKEQLKKCEMALGKYGVRSLSQDVDTTEYAREYFMENK